MPVVTVLLTATVDTHGSVLSTVENPEQRLSEYRHALRRWLAGPPDIRLVICENSGHDFTTAVASFCDGAVPDHVELMSFQGQAFDRTLGKGYGELLTFEHAARYSRLFRTSDLILKVNGRYFVRNGRAIVERLSNSDSPYIIGNFRHQLSWFDSRVFAFNPEFADVYLLPLKDMVNDSEGCYLEHVLAQAAHRAMADGRSWCMLPVSPVLIGRSGTTGRRYSVLGPRRVGKAVYLSAMRRLLTY